MRDLKLLNTVKYTGENVEIIKINGPLPPFDIQDYDLFDDKDFKRYIDSIEKICRKSREYRKYITFIRENMNMNQCSFLENVNNLETFKIKIEIHHEPFTLFDIVMIVYNKRLRCGEPLDNELVAKEVMMLHYSLLVGLIPLSETVHELVHNNYLFVPMDKVLGNVEQFYNLYYDYIPPDMKDLYESNIQYTKNLDESLQMGVLEKKYIYLDTSDCYEQPNYQELVTILDDKIKQLKKKNYAVPLVEPFKFINR